MLNLQQAFFKTHYPVEERILSNFFSTQVLRVLLRGLKEPVGFLIHTKNPNNMNQALNMLTNDFQLETSPYTSQKIIPKNKYFLKSKFNEIITVNDVCPKSNNYQCSSHNQLNGRSICEVNILLEGDSKFYNYTKLNLEEGHLEIVNGINQYLVVFPQEEKITIRCNQRSDNKALHGI